jgi:glycyl-tRNA synthetase
MAKPLSFQQIILTLQRYWAEQGCLVWYPYSEKVGAGTANSATTLRALGPEPWNVAYVEPSFRPDDGRYADNPNRMQMHTQFQVILKPDPGDPQELYLNSLYALGIKREAHDIRFVEDNWESPALGAWGLGWEVWLDGLEITQYTYFQQFGGTDLDPVAVELTYGLERIALFLQGVDSVWEIDWDGVHTYGDILRQQEVEYCVYNFEVADIDRLLRSYDVYEQEAKSCLDAGLVVPAHDYVLRCSHTFNLLDSRGAIGVTERASYFARMRDLSRQVAAAFLQQRENAGYPFNGSLEKNPTKAAVAGPVPETDVPATFLLEVGTEELPPDDVAAAISQLQRAVPAMLQSLRLAYKAVQVVGTPRRLAVLVEGLAPRQADEDQQVKGPPTRAAYDEGGQPTKAALGFARSQGVAVETLQTREEGGGEYVFAVREIQGLPTGQVLAESLADLIAGLSFGKSMRWLPSEAVGGAGASVRFSRPIRWLVCLLGDHVLPFEFAGVSSGRVSRGPRSDGSVALQIDDADSYLRILAAQGVIVDPALRRQEIQRQLDELAAEAGGTVPPDDALLDEVTNLVEKPQALLGSFNSDYLVLPEPVLVTVMKKHQRYFPVVGHNGKLLPHFIAVRNGGLEHIDTVRQGNEKVLRARYADADYFFRIDTSKSLEDYLPRLDTLLFQEQLGSMLDKTRRIEALVPQIAEQIKLGDASLAAASRAARLCKADLATQMVIELTSLQGAIGREYALRSGEDEVVADAIFEHYLPRFAGDRLPSGRVGLVVGIANRLDSLIGLFSAGLAPTGSADPYGLRREALGLVTMLLDLDIDFSVTKGLLQGAALLPDIRGVDEDAVLASCRDFVGRRLEGVLRERGLRHDVVQAVLAELGDNPTRAYRTAQSLQEWVTQENWESVLVAYARCKRIVRPIVDDVRAYQLEPDALDEDSHALWAAYTQATRGFGSNPGVDEILTALTGLAPYINTFFDKVMVMAEDEAVRRNRLALVYAIAALPDGVADLSQLMGF